MKSLLSSRRIFITIFIVLAVVLVACERQIQEEEPVPTQAVPVLTPPAVQPTTDPVLVPTTDPALQPTVDPALVPTTDPLAPTADPNVQATPVSTSPVTHVVGEGETLFIIASQYGLTLEELAAANNLDQNGLLTVGQTLVVPVASAVPPANATATTPAVTAAGEQIHIVQAGENLFRIGLRYGFTVAELAAYNNIPNPDRISVGQEILIPPGGNQQ